jgi:serine/threonine protein kinase/formylglycine-generating enzyme required for sulfatase activity
MDIPGYTILRELGRGGMATVYLARQDRLGRQVALKVMQPPPGIDEDFTARFIKEGRIIARLQHPRIVTIYDLDSIGELHYFSMEFLPNGTLADLIQAGLSATRATEILRCLAEALSIAHDNGVIHRDIKPQNILFRTDGSPVLTDFGIARAASTGAEATALTTFGMVIGSPRYMSPEQSMSQPIDARADLYSLGCVFYEMLTQELPYQAEDVISLAIQHCSAPLPELPGSLSTYQSIIARLLAKNPEQRFSSTQALMRALNQLEQGAPAGQAQAPPDATVVTPHRLGKLPEATVVTAAEPDSDATRIAASPSPSRRKQLAGGLALLFFIGIAAGLAVLVSRQAPDPPGDQVHTNPAPEPEPTLVRPETPALERPKPGEDPKSQDEERQLRKHITQATDLIAAGRLQESLALIDQGLTQLPGNLQLAELRNTLREQIRREQQRQVEHLRDQAETQLQTGELESAWASAERALGLQPADEDLKQLRTRVLNARSAAQVQSLLDRARTALEEGHLEQAAQLTASALELRPDHPQARAFNERIAARQAAQAQRAEAITECLNLERATASAAELGKQLSTLTAVADCLLALAKDGVIEPDLAQPLDRVTQNLSDWAARQPAPALLEQALKLIGRLAAVRPENTKLMALRHSLASAAGLIPEMTRIAGGCFTMGTPETAALREPDESPRRVCVEDFSLASSETQHRDFARFVAATDYRTDAERGTGGTEGCWSFDKEAENPWGYHPQANWRTPNPYQSAQERHPVTCISANDAQAYLHWLSDLTGQPYRLPTEAEWEYAARAATDTPVFWGEPASAATCQHANVADLGHDWTGGFDCDDGHEWVADVNHFTANPWGLYDMLGNVAEWTCSEYRERYGASETYCAAPNSDAPIVLRGGGWNSSPANLRAAYRNRDYRASRYSFVGFRIARDD